MNLCLLVMSSATSHLPFFPCIFCKKSLDGEAGRSGNQETRISTRQVYKRELLSSIGNTSEKNKFRIYCPCQLFWMNQIQNKSELLCLEERAVLSHVPRDSNASGWDGSMPPVPSLAVNLHGRSVYARETDYSNFLLFQDPFCRVADPGWLPGFLRQWRGSHVALQALTSPNTRPL